MNPSFVTMRISLLSCSLLLAMSDALAQPAFEVASIRPNPGPYRVLRGYSATGTTIALEGYTVADLIVEAYALEDYQLRIDAALFTKDGQPVFYNIAAKAPGAKAPTRAEVREMLQQLLTERFHLRLHRETRDTSVYALLPAKNGAKLRASNPDVPRSANHRVRGRNQTIEVTHMTMQELTRELRSYVDRPVVDKTGLAGEYDINLEATPFFRLNNNPQPEDIVMFSAIQETLGLRLEAETAPMPVLVVDAVDPPTEH